MMIRGLSPFMRIMYCSGVWSYIVGAITTPLFIIIPLLTIWAGIFPIVISWWAALALTIYYIAQSLVLNYSKKVCTFPFCTVTYTCLYHRFICLLTPLQCTCVWKLFKEWYGSLLAGGFLSAALRVADGMPSCMPGSYCFAQLECILGRNLVVCCGTERGGTTTTQ